MKLRNTILATCVATMTMGWGCGVDDPKPTDTSILEDAAADTVTPDVAEDVAVADTAPDVVNVDVPTTEVAEDTATEEVAVEDVAVEDTTVEDTTVEDIAEEVVIPTSPVLKRGDRCDELSTLGVDTLPLMDTVADTSIFTDRYIYTLGPACGGTVATDNWGDSSPDVVYTLTPSIDGFYTIKATPTATFDLGLMVTEGCPPRNESDLDAIICLGAADSGVPGEGVAEVVETHLTAGVTYFIVVDGFDNVNSATGGFTLDISLGEDCGDRIDNDANGDTDCADAQCAGAPACDEYNTALYGATACSNTTDDDGDSFTDCADDDCALAPNCIETLCDDLVDNNDNGFTDCADPGCDGSPSCALLGDTCSRPLTLTAGNLSTTFNTCNLANDYAMSGSNGCKTMGSAGDAVATFTAAEAGSYVIKLGVPAASPTFDQIVNVVKSASCPASAPSACFGGVDAIVSARTPEILRVEALAGETFWVIADSYDSTCGLVTLEIKRLSTEVCDDLSDNDEDGKTDCADPDCYGVGTCPQALPGDSCGTAFSVTDGLLDINFDSCTLNNDYAAFSSGLCKTMGTGGDAVATFTAQEAGSYMVELGIQTGSTAFNQIINVVKSNSCPASAPLVCSGGADAVFSTGVPEKIRVNALAGETFWVVADSNSTTCGLSNLKITKLPDEICDDLSDNDQDGISDCADSDCFGVGACPTEPLGYSCTSPFVLEAGVLNATFNSCSYANTFEASSVGGCQKMGNGGNSIATFTAEEAGSFVVTYGLAPNGVYFDRILNVVKSPTCPASAPTSCAYSTDTGSATTPERVRINAQAGETFWIITDGWFNSPTANCGLSRLTINKIGPEVCDDGLDNDDNNFADCADIACASSLFCNESATVGGCSDGVTNDNDALVDCADPDCKNDTAACPNGLLGDTCASPIEFPADISTSLAIDLCTYSDNFVSIAGLGNAVCKAVDANAGVVTKDFVVSYTPTATGRFAATAVTTAANVVLHRVNLADCTTSASRKSLENCVASVNAVTTAAGTERIDFDGVSGETVYFIVDGATATCGNVAFKVQPITNEACDNGTDDDVDGKTDCFDSDCFGVGSCPDGLPGDTCASANAVNTATTYSVNTCGNTNAVTTTSSGGCEKNSSTTSDSKDHIIAFTAPITGRWRVTVTSGFDILLHRLATPTCADGAIATCSSSVDVAISSGFETFDFDATAGTAQMIIVDAYSTSCGDITVKFEFLTAPENCSDTIDNDGDTLVDCDDPACFGAVRAAPLTDCPTPPAPVCTTDLAISALPYTDTGRDLCNYDTVYDYDSSTNCETGMDPTLGGAVYTYTATVAETVRVTATPVGEYYDFFDQASYPIDLVLNLTKGCGADGNSVLTCEDSSDLITTEVAQVTLAAGETVFIHVNLYDGSFGNECGTINLNVTPVTP